MPEWVTWVQKINRINVARTNQRFYIADVDGVPAGVCLLLLSGDVGGSTRWPRSSRTAHAV